MIDFLPMCGTDEMLIQRAQGSEAVLAEVATVPGPVPSSTCSQCSRSSIIVVPANLLVGEEMVRIDFSAVLVDLLAIDTRCTGTGL